MATVSKEIAERQIAHCQTLKRPKMYCIVKYQNILFNQDDYSLCYREKDYRGLFESPAVGTVTVLWASRRSGLSVPPDRSHLNIDPVWDDELCFAVEQEQEEYSLRNHPKHTKRRIGRR